MTVQHVRNSAKVDSSAPSGAETAPGTGNGRVFIAYRRSDAGGFAGRLEADLVSQFGRRRVFRDINTIQGGEDFRDRIRAGLKTADVVLVLIGKRWLDAPDDLGGRRLNDASDVHRIEIAMALDSGTRLIPVLLEKTAMPRAEELPPSISKLSDLHAVEVDDARWEYDVKRLARAIDPLLRIRSLAWAGLSAAVVCSVAAGAWMVRQRDLPQIGAYRCASAEVVFQNCAVERSPEQGISLSFEGAQHDGRNLVDRFRGGIGRSSGGISIALVNDFSADFANHPTKSSESKLDLTTTGTSAFKGRWTFEGFSRPFEMSKAEQ